MKIGLYVCWSYRENKTGALFETVSVSVVHLFNVHKLRHLPSNLLPHYLVKVSGQLYSFTALLIQFKVDVKIYNYPVR